MPSPEPAAGAAKAVPPALPAPTDAELAARARQRDDLAFELIMRRHNRRLFRLARSLLRDDAEAEDALQETYVRAYARLGDLEDGQALAQPLRVKGNHGPRPAGSRSPRALARPRSALPWRDGTGRVGRARAVAAALSASGATPCLHPL